MMNVNEEDLDESLDKLINCDSNKNGLYKTATVIKIPEMLPENVSSNNLSVNYQPGLQKESLLGSFNKHLRHSIRAINESPSAITRCDSPKHFLYSF